MRADNSTVIWRGLQGPWFHAVNHVTRVTPWLHTPARLYAVYGVLAFAAVLLWSWWLARREGELRRVTAALWAPAATLTALGINQFLVRAFDEARPYTVYPHALVLVARSTDPAFPSDHAVMAGAVAAGVAWAHRALGVLATSLALLMAADRVYVGAHFPLDVVVGLAVGATLAVASYLVVRPLVHRLVEALARTRLRILVTAVPASRLPVRPPGS